jgi:D-3-phosphoglycerate dehydrogenase
LRYYVADFPHPRLVGRPDCLLMPHIGASTEEAARMLGAALV